jgi:hypothetical protein
MEISNKSDWTSELTKPNFSRQQMNQTNREPCELAEVVYEKPLSGAFEEVPFGSDRGNTLWVKFSGKNGINEWIGKFGDGGRGARRVTRVEEPDKFLVCAGSFAYFVDATTRQLLNQFCNDLVTDVTYDSKTGSFIVTDGIRLRIIKSGQEIWASKRIALDGIHDLKIEGRIVSGLAEVGFKGEEEKFTFDLDTREVKIAVDFSSWDELLRKSPGKKPWWKC